MADLAEPADVAVDRDIVGRVGEDHLGLLAVHQGGDDFGIERVAADEPVRSEPPQVARPTARRDPVGIRQLIVRRIARLFRRQALHQLVDLGDREAGDADVEADVGLHQLLQLERQQLFVPAGVEGELVVGQHIGPLLGRRHVVDPQARHGRHPKFSRGLDPAVAGEDAIVSIDQDRIGEAEAADAVGDLSDLLARMDAGVARPGTQLIEGQGFEKAGGHGREVSDVRLDLTADRKIIKTSCRQSQSHGIVRSAERSILQPMAIPMALSDRLTRLRLDKGRIPPAGRRRRRRLKGAYLAAREGEDRQSVDGAADATSPITSACRSRRWSERILKRRTGTRRSDACFVRPAILRRTISISSTT